MLHLTLESIVHGLLYIMAAALMFIVFTPRSLASTLKRRLLFLGLLVVFTTVFLSLEEIDSLVYALHLTSVSLALAVLYEGLLPGIVTGMVLFFGGTLLYGNHWLPTGTAITVLLLTGLLFHFKIKPNTQQKLSVVNLFLVLLYMLAYIGVSLALGHALNVLQLGIIAVGAAFSSLLISFIYFNVKNREWYEQMLIISEKNQIVGQLAASISHEIRNPLTTTRGFLQLMSKEPLDRETFERYRTYAFEGIDHANAIITDYLNFSKPSEEERRLLNVKDEIDGVIPWLKPYSALSNISVEVYHLSKEPLIICGEVKKFQQCMLNIMKNGIEAMPEGGKLTVQTELVRNKIQILVRDTGCGMNRSQVKRLGLPYYTTKERGTGLGLMVVMNMVKEMNGKIFFHSKTNQGTICELQLERAAASE
ncbi:ATP-binding protein [Paenibacillus sp. BIHB 4019]|nr:ATP-binding protein [Paenibacillus sp. BIHB 4019]